MLHAHGTHDVMTPHGIMTSLHMCNLGCMHTAPPPRFAEWGAVLRQSHGWGAMEQPERSSPSPADHTVWPGGEARGCSVVPRTGRWWNTLSALSIGQTMQSAREEHSGCFIAESLCSCEAPGCSPHMRHCEIWEGGLDGLFLCSYIKKNIF